MHRSFPRLTFRFGEFECDGVAYELRRKGRRVRLARQPMDLLFLLVERRGELVSREEIARYLWRDGVFVDVDAGVRTAILKIRRALADSPESSRFVETVPGKGYRFVAQVDVLRRNASAQPGQSVTHTATRVPHVHNLPAHLTSFVGREHDLGQLRQLLVKSRLLSLMGPGGVGKTRLAIRLASEVVDAFPDGVWLVDVASLDSASLIPQSIATLFSVRESPQRSLREALVDYLRDRRLLLVVDTCEHLLDGCAELAEALLHAAPRLCIVATSREALQVPGETVYQVAPLPVPSELRPPAAVADSDATTLFLDRARAARPGFSTSPDETGTVAAICRRLDGIPLAIELAAAQLTMLSLQQIEARLTDGFRTTATRTSVVRQRTLDATVQWSYQLLTESEQRLFERLSVFPASWTLAAAEHVCSGDGIDRGQVSDLLSRLVGKSLVIVDPGSLDGRRYSCLDTIRHFARQRLTEPSAVDVLRDRHFDFFHTVFRSASKTLSGPDQASVLGRLHVEQHNVRLALEWGLSSPTLAERGVEFAGALFWYWTKRGLFAEGRQWLERAATLPAPARLKAHVALGLGHMDYFQGRLADMVARNDEVLAWAREEDDAWLVSAALFGHGLAKFESGAFEEAAACAQAARDAAGKEGFGTPSLILGNVALVNGEHDRALALFQEAIADLRYLGENWGLGIVLSVAAGLQVIRADFVQARTYAMEAMQLYRELEDPRGVAWTLDVFAGLKAAEGHVDDAARLWGAADGLLESVGGALVPTIAWIRDRYLAPATAALGEPAFDSAWAEGRALPAEQALALAIAAR